MNWLEKILAVAKQHPHWTAVVIGVLVGWLVALLFWADPGNAAAWVQACGTIGAVCSAVFLARKQSQRDRESQQTARDHQKKIEQELRKTRLRSIVRVANKCADKGREICASLDGVGGISDKNISRQRIRLDMTINWLDQMPISSEPGVLISWHLSVLKMLFKYLINYMDSCGGGLGGDKFVLEEIDKGLVRISKTLGEYADGYDGEYEEWRVSDFKFD